MWIRFTERFDFIANAAVTVVFRPDGGPLKDGRYSVTRACAEAAVEAGKAETCQRPKGRF
jgi:hypothetical protein